MCVCVSVRALLSPSLCVYIFVLVCVCGGMAVPPRGDKGGSAPAMKIGVLALQDRELMCQGKLSVIRMRWVLLCSVLPILVLFLLLLGLSKG